MNPDDTQSLTTWILSFPRWSLGCRCCVLVVPGVWLSQFLNGFWPLGADVITLTTYLLIVMGLSLTCYSRFRTPR